MHPVIFIEVDLDSDFAAINRSMRKILEELAMLKFGLAEIFPNTEWKNIKEVTQGISECGKAENLDPTDCSLVNPSVSTPNY